MAFWGMEWTFLWHVPTVPPFPEETSSMDGLLFYSLFLLGLVLFLGALFYNRRKGK